MSPRSQRCGKVQKTKKPQVVDLRPVLFSEGDGTRTRNHRIDSPAPPTGNDNASNDLGKPEILRAQGRAQKGPDSALSAVASDADLAAVVAAWPTLPKATRRRILALVKAPK
jgi:hypothetical protein